MFNPQELFPIVRKSLPKGTDEQVMGALTKLAQAHPDLTAEQALAALQQAIPGQQPSAVGKYLGGGI